ncbi:MAG: hypothetical protein ACK4TA_21465 [Saprospiraceae bacterium]
MSITSIPSVILGILLILGIFIHQVSKTEKDSDIEAMKRGANFLKKYIFVLGLGLVLFGLIKEIIPYIIYIHPSRIIVKYYNNLTSKEYEKAWDDLSSGYQFTKYDNNFQALVNSYETTMQVYNITTKINSHKSFFDIFYSRSLEFIVEYDVEDRLTYDQLSEKGRQKWNTLWLMLQYNRYSVTSLRNLNNRNYTMKRHFIEKIGLIKENKKWKINSVSNVSVALNRKD